MNEYVFVFLLVLFGFFCGAATMYAAIRVIEARMK